MIEFAFPKHRAYRDARAVQWYKQQHPRCEACGHRRSEEAHHLISRIRGGSDVDANLLALCHRCHFQWTGVNRTRREWFIKYAATMSQEARLKVRRALRLSA